ncbi:MAG: GNAT family N-acetyltransferase [Clostridia bacterium]|nr:GNAT family N-acetyltransferase [Clostridia bacterium]
MNIDHPTPKHISGLKSLWKEAFGDSDEFINAFFDTAFSPDRCFAVAEGKDVYSALYVLDCSLEKRKIAYIYAVATSKVQRGNGLCKRLMRYAHERLKAAGYEGAVLVPGEKSLFDFYGSLGYITCGYKSRLQCASSGKTVNIKKIGKKEFAKLRRDLLPRGGIIQENANLDFLEKQAELYSGADFLLVARIVENRLFGIELLGNLERAADIVCSLGCADGAFMIPGGEIPFAMYLSFGDRGCYPEYFGLAFD